jgi:rhodanese-related sulfurtransferase
VLGAALLIVTALSFLETDRARSQELPAEAFLVDVRTPGEYAAGHARGAINIPLSELSGRLNELPPKDRPIVVYCRTGSRSRVAKRLLERAGFRRVINGGSLEAVRAARRRATGRRAAAQ